jgi:hypothetical protein
MQTKFKKKGPEILIWAVGLNSVEADPGTRLPAMFLS